MDFDTVDAALLTPDEERKNILQAGFLSSAFFDSTFFPDTFSSPFNEIHREMFDLIDARDSDGLPLHQYICMAAPRGIGKTSIARAIVAKAILYRLHEFIVWISNSATIAVMQTENLKWQLQSSLKVKKHFGSIKTKRDKDFEEQYSKEAWVASLPVDGDSSSYRGTMVFPRGSGQQVRGILFGSSRPSLFIIDDLENSDEVNNPDIRANMWKWLNADVLKAYDIYKPREFQFIYIDTLKHEDAVLMRVMKDKKWKAISLSICDDSYHTLVPTLYSDADIAEQVQEHRDNGTLDIFGREMMNQPISAEAAVFKQAYFRQYDPTKEKLDNNPDVENIVIIDPATTTNQSSCLSAICGVAFNRSTGGIFVRDIDAGHYHPDECAAHCFDMADRIGAFQIGIEVDAGQEFVIYPYETLMQTTGRFYNLVHLRARGVKTEMKGQDRSKYGRIAALISFYRRGLVFHNPCCCGILETQLLSFPRGARDDVADCLAYLIEMFSIGGLSFPKISLEGKEDAGIYRPNSAEDEFEELKKLNLPTLDIRSLQPACY